MPRPPWKASPDARESDADLKRLANCTSVLPRVEADQSSPCPFAGQLFEAARKAAEKVEEDIHYWLQDLDDARAEKQKAQEEVDHGWTHLGVREHEEMLPKLKRDLESSIEIITLIQNKIAECRKALDQARPRIEKGAHFLK